MPALPCGADVESWTIYDNTAGGAALYNALDLLERVNTMCGNRKAAASENNRGIA